MSNSEQSGGMIFVGRLWKGKTKAGDNMLSGSNGNLKFVILPNKKKSKDTDADCNLFVCQAERKENKSGGGDNELV